MGRLIPIILIIFLTACAPDEDEIAPPPAAKPLSQEGIGWVVVKVSYARILGEPEAGGVSLGYVREGALLRALERKLAADGEYWILTSGAQTGWIPESSLALYGSEEKAKTASREAPQ